MPSGPHSVSATAIADRVPVEDVAFIEFAADEREKEELVSAALRTMGFMEAGASQKPSDVTLFRQGDINLVINTEKEGFSHSSYHGPWHLGLRHRA